MRSTLMSLVLLGVACAPAGKFVRTDPAFVVAARSEAPAYFVDRSPTRPYRAVGRVEVVLPETATPDEVRAAALDKGRAVGCELLIATALHDKVSAAALHRHEGVILVHDFDPERHEVQHQPEKTYTFTCAVYTAGR